MTVSFLRWQKNCAWVRRRLYENSIRSSCCLLTFFTFPYFPPKMIGGPGSMASLSGLQEPDYPSMEGLGVAGLNQRSMMRKVPLPAELVEQFGHMQCNCLIGLFPELERAWLTIDSDIYVWRFSDGRDLAYFDGLADTILSVGLLEPKKGIFRPHIRHLLCLTTPVEIVLLGVTITESDTNGEEMQLLPEPLFTLSTDSTHMLCVKGTSCGRYACAFLENILGAP